jgi:hypothetical protein
MIYDDFSEIDNFGKSGEWDFLLDLIIENINL